MSTSPLCEACSRDFVVLDWKTRLCQVMRKIHKFLGHRGNENGSWSLVGHFNYEQFGYRGTFCCLIVAMFADMNDQSRDGR